MAIMMMMMKIIVKMIMVMMAMMIIIIIIMMMITNNDNDYKNVRTSSVSTSMLSLSCDQGPNFNSHFWQKKRLGQF